MPDLIILASILEQQHASRFTFSPFQTLKTTLQVDNMSEMSEASGASQLTTQTKPQLMSMGFYKVNLGTK